MHDRSVTFLSDESSTCIVKSWPFSFGMSNFYVALSLFLVHGYKSLTAFGDKKRAVVGPSRVAKCLMTNTTTVVESLRSFRFLSLVP